MNIITRTLILSLVPICSLAQDIASESDMEFRDGMRSIVSLANYYYDNSNINGILKMADSLKECLEVRSRHSMLTPMDSLEFVADWNKIMGSYYYEDGYYNKASDKKAEDHYKVALSTYQNTPRLQGNLSGEPLLRRELAQLYYRQGRYEEALHEIDTVCQTYYNALSLQEIDSNDEEYLDILSQQAICLARTGQFTKAVEMMDKIISLYTTKNERYGEALRKKAKILMLWEEAEGKNWRQEALSLYQNYFQLKKTDALNHFMDMSSAEREQYWMRIRPFVTDCYRLEDSNAGFLFDVTLFAKALLLQLDSTGGGRHNIHATWQMIQEKLKPNACAIEFIQYEKHGRQQMGALVLKKTGEPIFVKLSEPDSVMKYVIDGKTVEERIHHVKGADYANRALRNAVYNDSTGLFNRIWTPQLLHAIDDVRDIWFAPDGYMHRLAIEYMLPHNAEGKVCHRLTSTRRLLETSTPLSLKQALLIGGVAYNIPTYSKKEDNDDHAFSYMFNNGRPLYLDSLEHSLDAVKDICRIRSNTTDLLLTEAHATEQEFRQNSGNYAIVHISSHGVFASAATPQGTDLKANLCDSTLSHSLIALAGVNKNLADSNFNPAHQDGILSAKEIASLDLSRTELVILCCCETGLGYITADGVYGLQRGLKNAGAGAIICSLWDIYEGSSNLFMDVLHYHITHGQPLSYAFEEARKAMTDLEEGKAIDSAGSYIREISQHVNDNFDEPNYRNAFILIDALE